jgi:1,3-beta-glucan synthase
MTATTINNVVHMPLKIRAQTTIVTMPTPMNTPMPIPLVSNPMVCLVMTVLIVAGQQYYQEQRGYDRKGKRNGSSEEDSESFSDFTMRSDMARAAEMDMYRDERYYGRSTDSLSQVGDRRGYGRPPSSQISYGGNRSSGASTPIYGMDYQAGFGSNSREPYPAWTTDNQIPLSKEEIEAIFNELQSKFGFQMDSVRNMFDHMMMLLDSRASRMTPNQALLSLHADYIGGDNANYRKWYFAAQLDVDDSVGFANVKLGKTNKRTRKARAAAKKARGGQIDERTLEDLEGDNSLEAAEYRWKTKMNQMSQHDRARQLALYLCCWGEANQVRFVPECLCFIFKCCDDYLRSPECQSRYEPLEEGYYLNNVITPIYMYIRDQGYEIFEGKYVRREKDHNQVVGYDDINQLFWYPQGIERIVLQDKTRLIDVPSSQRFFKLGQVEWKKVFFKTYRETRSWFHMATNFNRIWIIHITMFWYYTAHNSPSLLMKDYVLTEDPNPPGASQWSAVALGGAVACIIMLVATIAEWAYVPRHFGGAQPLFRRFMFLLGVFLLNVAPSVYIFGFNNQGNIALTIGIVQFFISLATFIFFAVMPIGALFGNLFQRNPRRFLANRLFTANYPRLRGNDIFMSYGLWVLVFAAKLTESYFYLTLSLRDSILILSIMTVENCSDKILQSYLCKYQGRILLGLMVVTDLVLFFLDTYLWYIIWNTVFSVARSFYLGISIWTPWRNVFSRLPKRIYSKVLATGDMEIKYKPKVLISQIWNAIVISMYREHLLSIDHVQKLLYHQVCLLNNYANFRFPLNKKVRGHFVLPRFSSPKKITPSKLSFSHLTARQNVVSLSSPSLFPHPFLNQRRSITCPRLQFWCLITAKRFYCRFEKSFAKKISFPVLPYSNI